MDIDIYGEWYLKAEKGDNSDAQYQLGSLYEDEGENLDIAVHWYRKAAAQGFAKAKASLKRLGYSE